VPYGLPDFKIHISFRIMSSNGEREIVDFDTEINKLEKEIEDLEKKVDEQEKENNLLKAWQYVHLFIYLPVIFLFL
jgi:archaellum component FlaC